MKFVRHLFVCTNQRVTGPGGGGKPACDARALYEALQGELLAHGDLCERVAVTPSGCLGPCFDGPTMVVYPDGVWYARVQAGDAREIVEEHLAGGRPVERLRYHWPE